VKGPHKGYHKRNLTNGIRIIGEEIPDYNSVTVGIFVFCGGRDEPASQLGIAHFTEHMLFKGTKSRSALDISKTIDRIGGIINAYTNKEYTCYYVKIIKEKLELGLELLSDIFLNSVFPEDELEREKNVVLQEIGMVNDTPDDLVHDLVLQAIFGKDSLGHSLLGTEKHVKSFSRETVEKFVNEYYQNDRVVIAAAGNFKWAEFNELAEKFFGSRKNGNLVFNREAKKTGRDIKLSKSHLYQIHTAMGFKTVSIYDKDKYPLKVLNYILGAGMSSLLFQELREKSGYAYSVFSFTHEYQDTGYLEIYYGTSLKHHKKCMDKVAEILNKIAKGDIPKEEIGYAKEQMKGYSLIALDSSDARFSYNAKTELYYNNFIPLEKELEEVNKVTLDDVVRVANTYLPLEKAKYAIISPQEENENTKSKKTAAR